MEEFREPLNDSFFVDDEGDEDEEGVVAGVFEGVVREDVDESMDGDTTAAPNGDVDEPEDDAAAMDALLGQVEDWIVDDSHGSGGAQAAIEAASKKRLEFQQLMKKYASPSRPSVESLDQSAPIFPEDVWLNIFSYLVNVRDLPAVMRVCRWFARLGRDERFWRAMDVGRLCHSFRVEDAVLPSFTHRQFAQLTSVNYLCDHYLLPVFHQPTVLRHVTVGVLLSPSDIQHLSNYCSELIALDCRLSTRECTPALAAIGGLKRLQRIHLQTDDVEHATLVDPRAVAALVGGCRDLETMSCRGISVEHRGWIELSGAPRLQCLSVYLAQDSDAPREYSRDMVAAELAAAGAGFPSLIRVELESLPYWAQWVSLPQVTALCVMGPYAHTAAWRGIFAMVPNARDVWLNAASQSQHSAHTVNDDDLAPESTLDDRSLLPAWSKHDPLLIDDVSTAAAAPMPEFYVRDELAEMEQEGDAVDTSVSEEQPSRIVPDTSATLAEINDDRPKEKHALFAGPPGQEDVAMVDEAPFVFDTRGRMDDHKSVRKPAPKPERNEHDEPQAVTALLRCTSEALRHVTGLHNVRLSDAQLQAVLASNLFKGLTSLSLCLTSFESLVLVGERLAPVIEGIHLLDVSWRAEISLLDVGTVLAKLPRLTRVRLPVVFEDFVVKARLFIASLLTAAVTVVLDPMPGTSERMDAYAEWAPVPRCRMGLFDLPLEVATALRRLRPLCAVYVNPDRGAREEHAYRIL